MTEAKLDTKGQPGIESKQSIFGADLFALCPRCGAKGLFAGLTKFADRCAACDLNFAGFNVGDGPAAFVTLIFGGLITALAVISEVKWQPPFWVHVVLWVPLTMVLVIWGLRLGKAALLAAEFRNKAGEGRVKGE